MEETLINFIVGVFFGFSLATCLFAPSLVLSMKREQELKRKIREFYKKKGLKIPILWYKG